MNNIHDYKLYEYINLPEDEQMYKATQIVKDWISWGYKTVNQSSFLFIKYLFPELVTFTTMYRGLDVNYILVKPEDVREHIWQNNKGKYVSWCKDLSHTEFVLKNMKKRTGSTYMTIIKQKAMSISILDAITLLNRTAASYSPNWNFDNAVDIISQNLVSELVAPLSNEFTIEGVMYVHDTMCTLIPMKVWKEKQLPNIILNKKSTYKWQRDADKIKPL